MIAYGWKYAYRGFSSETFSSRESALEDLVARFPATAPYAEYLLTIERREDRPPWVEFARSPRGTD
jgi:hypothetical protein